MREHTQKGLRLRPGTTSAALYPLIGLQRGRATLEKGPPEC
jgi:hypothetical protein